MNLRQIVIFILFVPLLLHANNKKITEIIDSDRFQTNDNSVYMLAHIDAPSIYSSDSLDRYRGRYIKSKLETMLVDKSFNLIVDSARTDTVKYVHVIKKYPLSQVNYNEIILKEGLGYYFPEGDSLFITEYKKASEHAMLNKKGIWKIDETSLDKSIEQFSLKFGLGTPFSLGLKDKTYFTFAASFLYAKNAHQVLVRYIKNTYNPFEGPYPYGEGIFLRNTEIDLMYGRVFWRKDFDSMSHITISTGISYLNIVRRGDYISYENYKTASMDKIGLPLNLELGAFSTTNMMNVSIDLFANINSYNSYYGVMLAIGFHLTN